MKIYLAHSTHYDYISELYEPIKKSALAEEHEFIFLFDQKVTPGSTKEIIENCDLVIAEVSYSGIGLGIELGWADAFRKRIICIHKPGQLASKFLGIISSEIYEYSNTEDLITLLSGKII